jgi:tripartite-type tricarboxylate transporter receptor subunit TctC
MWFRRKQMGMLAPAGLPQDVLDKLTKAIKLAVESPEYLEQLKIMGFIPSWTTPEGYGEQSVKT